MLRLNRVPLRPETGTGCPGGRTPDNHTTRNPILGFGSSRGARLDRFCRICRSAPANAGLGDAGRQGSSGGAAGRFGTQPVTAAGGVSQAPPRHPSSGQGPTGKIEETLVPPRASFHHQHVKQRPPLPSRRRPVVCAEGGPQGGNRRPPDGRVLDHVQRSPPSPGRSQIVCHAPAVQKSRNPSPTHPLALQYPRTEGIVIRRRYVGHQFSLCASVGITFEVVHHKVQHHRLAVHRRLDVGNNGHQHGRRRKTADTGKQPPARNPRSSSGNRDRRGCRRAFRQRSPLVGGGSLIARQVEPIHNPIRHPLRNRHVPEGLRHPGVKSLEPVMHVAQGRVACHLRSQKRQPRVSQIVASQPAYLERIEKPRVFVRLVSHSFTLDG